jgi:RNA polymerase sigma factor (sigma-70 family)
MRAPVSEAKNFGLSKQEFDQLKANLKAGDESIFRTIFLAHFESCIRYLKNQYGLQHDKAYDFTMDALLLFRKKLLDDKINYGNLRFLFTQIASQLYLKSIQRQPSEAVKTEVQQLLSDVAVPLDKEALDLLNKAWVKLGDSCKSLLKRFYYQNVSLLEIAGEQQKPAASLRKQKQRCVEKLRDYYKTYYQF